MVQLLRKSSYNSFLSEKCKQEIIHDYVENGLSIRELVEKYNVKSKNFLRKLLREKIRSKGESSKLAHKKFSIKFKHSEETKSKIRDARLKFMKENPDKTAWRKINLSYPEKCFQKILQEEGFDKRWLICREYSIFPYFIDFAFVDLKIAVEIDGSQHLNSDRKASDKKKDVLLNSLGWRVLRFTAKDVMYNRELIIKELKTFIKDVNVNYKKVGILLYSSPHKKKERGEDGLTLKQREQHFNQRKVKNRPLKEELNQLIKNQSFSSIARKYNVSITCIKKWAKNYGLPFRKKELEKI